MNLSLSTICLTLANRRLHSAHVATGSHQHHRDGLEIRASERAKVWTLATLYFWAAEDESDCNIPSSHYDILLIL